MDTTKLQESIKYDVDRLANLGRLEQQGLMLLQPASDVEMVRVLQRLKNGSRRERCAVRVSEHSGDWWYCWHVTPGGQVALPYSTAWADLSTRWLNDDQPIIEQIIYVGASGTQVFTMAGEDGESIG